MDVDIDNIATSLLSLSSSPQPLASNIEDATSLKSTSPLTVPSSSSSSSPLTSPSKKGLSFTIPKALFNKKVSSNNSNNSISLSFDKQLSEIETLAELASQKSPLKQQKSSSFIMNDITNTNDNISHDEDIFLTFARRQRAYSEPWDAGDASWIHKANAFNTDIKPASSSSVSEYLSLEKYASMINKEGRIGIYTREERREIIRRYHEKRKRRVWKKKIRYHCRKNLADRRVRVKGRFVKAEELGLIVEEDDDEDEYEENIDAANIKEEILAANNGNTNTDDQMNIDNDDNTNDDKPLFLSPQGKRLRRHSIAY